MSIGRTRAAPSSTGMSPGPATTNARLLMAYLSIVVLAALLNPASSATNHTTTTTNSTASNKSSTRGLVKQQLIILDPQQPQSTDVSNMYVQVPIAEQAETGVADGVQQTLTNSDQEAPAADVDSPSSGKAANSWTGPWPKKFQIGYIKQSDLHQVLIESLKGDPFVSLTSSAKKSLATGSQHSSTPPSVAAVKGVAGGQVSESSDSSSLMSTATLSKQWATGSGSGSHSLPKRTPATVYELQMNRPIAHIMAARHVAKLQQQSSSLSGSNGFTFGGQHPPQTQQMDIRHHNQRLIHQAASKFPTSFHQQQQQQPRHFHLANFANSMKSQPIYTINGFQQNEMLDPVLANYQQQQQQQLKAQQQFIGRGRPMTDYYSSWRPVQTDAALESAHQSGKQQQQKSTLNDFQSSLADDFEEGFSAPSRPELPTTPSMNRHPMLNSYLSATGARSTTPRPTIGGTKTSSSQPTVAASSTKGGSTKGGSRPVAPGGTKDAGGSDEQRGLVSPAAGKRRITPQTNDGGAVKGAEPEVDARSGSTESPPTTNSTTDASVTPISSVPSSTTGSSSTSTTTTSTEPTTTAEATTESDAETIEPETTEPTTGGSVTTTTGGPTSTTTNNSSTPASASSSGSVTSADLTTAMNQQTSDDSEVVTQSSGRQPATTEDATGSTSSLATRSTMREDTTPVNQAGSSESSTLKIARGAAEIEGSSRGSNDIQSEQVLLAAAARTGSELGKTNSNQQQRANQTAAPNNNAKRVRSSSERLMQKSTGSKTAKQVAAASQLESGGAAKTTSGQRKTVPSSKQAASGKQVSAETKGSSSKVRAPAATEKTKKPSTKKTTRMVSQTQVLSMSAEQAQTTAQTLASLLLSKCMSSSNCLHLLDVCSTKQPNLSFASTISERSAIGDNGNNNSLAWSMPEGLVSSSLVSLASSLQADRVFQLIPQWRDALDNLVDHGSLALGYTLFLPSNEAIERLPVATLNTWLANSDLLNQIIDNHMLDTTETFEVLASGAGQRQQLSRNGSRSRLIRQKGLQVNQHRDRMLTINGKRIIYANQLAPANGRIHVIDGILDWPAQHSSPASSVGLLEQPKPLLDIMDTLKQCDKFDGFVTLAEGTGLTQILKQDGPLTVFVPSNEALRKIPDDELEVIKNNSTALKEFLLYHVVNGSYFSQDLRDGQQLGSLLDMKPIQVGVRVDGCSRRLVEANTSPMRRPDIVAKNGVIHILDWYLTVRDNDWCEPTKNSQPDIVLDSSSPASTSISSSSERLQQLASEQIDSMVSYGTGLPAQLSSGPAYATRMNMPANHKPASSSTSSSPKLVADSINAIVSNHKGSLESAALTSSASLPQSPFLQQLMNMNDRSPNSLITSVLSHY